MTQELERSKLPTKPVAAQPLEKPKDESLKEVRDRGSWRRCLPLKQHPRQRGFNKDVEYWQSHWVRFPAGKAIHNAPEAARLEFYAGAMVS